MGESGCQPLKKNNEKKSISKVKSKMNRPETIHKSIHSYLKN